MLRGDTTATSTVIKTFTDRHDVVEPAAARVRRHHRASRLEPDLPDPHDGPDGNTLAGPPATVTIPAGSPPAASTYNASVQADNPELAVAPR